jgi:Tfp pilus assembly protein PilN
MRAVNLLPAPRVEHRQDDGRRRGRTTKAVAIAAGLLLVFVTAVLGFAFMHERSAVNDRRSTLDGLQTQVAQNQAAKASSAAAAAATQAQITAITSAATGRIAWDDLLNQLSRVMPSGASLVSLQASDGNGTSPASTPSTTSSSTPSTSTTTSSAPASSLASSTTGSASAPTSFVVTGTAVSQATVAQVLDRLALIPALSDVSLQSTQRADAAGTTTTAAPNTNAVPTNAVPTNAVQFTIGATLRSAGGTPQ